MLRRIQGALPVFTLLLAAWLLGNLAWLWSVRIGHPFDLEWMEGGMLAHGWRLMHGLPLYPEPGPEFIPFVYPPGYSALLAASGGLFGLGYPVGRLWSLFGALAAAGALAWGVRRHTGQGEAAVVGAVIFLGAYPASGAFYDLVRPDGLAMGLLAWALVLALEPGRRALVCAGLLLALAFTVKHHVAAFGLPILCGIWVREGWRRALLFGLSAVLPAGLFTLWMQWMTEGRFLIYLVEVPASHPRYWERALPGLPRELGSALPFAVAFPAFWALFRTEHLGRRLSPALTAAAPVVVGVAFAWFVQNSAPFGPSLSRFGSAWGSWGLGAGLVIGGLALGSQAFAALKGGEGRGSLDWRWVYGAGVVAVGIGVAGLMRAHNGGYLNVYVHLHWMVAALFAGVLARLAMGRLAILGWGLACAQLLWQITALDAPALAPTSDDRRAGEEAVEILRKLEGPVLSPWAAWLPVAAGHEPSIHYIALWDLQYPDGPYRSEVSRIHDAVLRHHWGAAVDGSRPFGYGLRRHYEVHRAIPLEGPALRPKTGWKVRPERVLVPRQVGGAGEGLLGDQ